MADVRALLKAKRQEARITHPLATYNANNQLRCAVCASIVKHASAWEGHLGSKAHRLNVAKLKEEERIREEQRLKEEEETQARILRSKRKALEEEEEEEEEEVRKRQKLDAEDNFPMDFFSDPSRVLPDRGDVSDDENNMSAAPNPPQPVESAIDLEWARFQQEVVNAPDRLETYENATVVSEPVLMSTTEGMPQRDGEEVIENGKATEEEERQQKALDERELIMDRLMDEERAQEEADMRVIAMKNRLDALKKERAAKLRS